MTAPDCSQHAPSKRCAVDRLIAIAFLLTVGVFPTGTGCAEEPIDFVRDVEPILTEHCLDCHGADLRESGLRVDDRANLLQGGDHGRPAIVPGKPADSFLLQLVRGTDPDLQMPPEGDLLPAAQVEILERWIREGAIFPKTPNGTPAPLPDHWSFQPVTKPDVPGDGSMHPIDAFIRQRLTESELQPSASAAPHTLVRRVTQVLTGLPPSPEEVAGFVAAENHDQAYEKMVDRLLNSPRYGERWAQHWLDVIRWAETVGFETNLQRPNAWPYRDWVIAALNEDKPYDRFLFEQLAGDTVGADAALGFLVAGPANLPGQIGRDEEAMRQARQDELDEVIRTVSQSILGLTLDCARCHSHKFDPLSQRDYYSMQAVFAGLRYGERRWRGPENDEWTAQIPEAAEKLKQLQEELETLRTTHQLDTPLQGIQSDSFDAITVTAVRMNIHATGNGGQASLYEFEVWSATESTDESVNVALASRGAVPSASSFALANQTRHFENLTDGSVDQRQAFPWLAASRGPAWIQVDLAEPAKIDRVTWHRGSSVPADYDIQVLPAGSGEWVRVAHSRQRLLRQDDTRRADSVRLSGLSTEQTTEVVGKLSAVRAAQQNLNRLSAGPQVYAASFVDHPQDTWLLRRGDAMQRLEVVPPAVPAVLRRVVESTDTTDSRPAVDLTKPIRTRLEITSEPERRLALANHVTRPDHPLTARVIVNRVWQAHFGTGLVDTPSDLGRMGSKPTHPRLLDWLAADLVEHGWSLKRLHRQIVLSQTFRQSSRPQPEALQVDAGSRLLWRFPPRRLEAEAIRDSVLSVSGKLNLKTGGPGFDFFNQRGGLSDYIPKETFDESGWRRMIYAHKIRMQSVDIFGTFDCPDAGQMTPQRTRSITPLQSLSLLNSPFAGRQAEFFASRAAADVGDDVEKCIERIFLLAYSRPPTDGETRHLSGLAENHGLPQVCRVIFNSSEFLFLQ